MDIDTRYNDGPVQVTSGRPEETGPSDPALFIQDLANKVCRVLSIFSQYPIESPADQRSMDQRPNSSPV
jgi:hypothetical protein